MVRQFGSDERVGGNLAGHVLSEEIVHERVQDERLHACGSRELRQRDWASRRSKGFEDTSVLPYA
jgi:hypothetical protein